MPSPSSNLPPLWMLPRLLTQIPRAALAKRRGDYAAMMHHMRGVMAEPDLKARAFKGYKPTPHDIFVCTYAKSGTNWMLQIVTQIAGLGAADFDHIHDIVPWPEAPVRGVKLTDPSWQSSPVGLRAVKTHNEAEFVPYSAAARYIIVVRDPKDVIISSFYFACGIIDGLDSIGLSRWLDHFVADETIFGSWPAHTASYWLWRERPNALLLTFGEMKRDLTAAVDQVADFMGVNLSAAQRDQVIDKSGFAHMKANDHKFRPSFGRGEPPQMMRRGLVGESKELLSADQLARIDREMAQQLEERGCDFPYHRMFSNEYNK